MTHAPKIESFATPSHKAHFIFLDGLRGVAALTVGWLHAAQIFALGYSPTHAVLAVDFFFCLSGFVIAYAYEDKLDAGMSFSEFGLKRIIRLYPMIVCGVAIGAVVSVFGNHGGLARVVEISAASLLLLPLGLLFNTEAYPINGPLWSLFFELVASAAYAVQRRFVRLKGAFLALPALAGAAIALVVMARQEHNLGAVGYANIPSFLGGFIRVTFPFLAGVLIYRYSAFKVLSNPPSYVVAALLFAILAAPIFPDSWAYDSFTVVVLFPVLLMMGVNAVHSGKLSQLWTILGKVSYPFYIIHHPVLRALSHLQTIAHLPEWIRDIMPIFSLLLTTGLAYGILILYDEPVRGWLSSIHRRSGPARWSAQRIVV